MKWVVQADTYHEYKYHQFLANLKRLGIEHHVVKPVPCTDIILDEQGNEFDLDQTDGVMVFGSITLCRIARQRGWFPGTFTNENFTFGKWREGFGNENLLNGDAFEITVKECIDFTSENGWVFIRPSDDDKAFKPQVISDHDLHDWALSNSIEKTERFTPVHKDTKIVIAMPKQIHAEYRFFVVDDRIVASSQYKFGDTVIYQPVNDPDLRFFASRMVNRWQPAAAFVLDVATTNAGYKVIEINSINSAGFYAADTQLLIDAIERLYI